jgi:hypothetical protein
MLFVIVALTVTKLILSFSTLLSIFQSLNQFHVVFPLIISRLL